jgi:hypothetical protein
MTALHHFGDGLSLAGAGLWILIAYHAIDPSVPFWRSTGRAAFAMTIAAGLIAMVLK